MKYLILILAVALMTMAAPAVAQTTIFTGAVQDGNTVLPNQVNPAAFGTVDPTGVADSTAAFQAAINTGLQVAVPPGKYQVCGLLPYVLNDWGIIHLVGPANDRQRQGQYNDSQPGTELVCASGDMFVEPSTPPAITIVGISGFELESATGGGHIFNFGSAYIVDFEMTDIFFSQNNPAKSWIVGSGGMQEMTMDHVFGTVAAGNTVAAVQLDGAINVMDIGDLNISSMGTSGSYSAHYLFELNQNSGVASNVHIHDSLCEQATAGCFNLNNIGNASIDDVQNYDQPTTPTAPFITIGSASSQVELKSLFSDYGTASTPDLVCPAGVCEFHNTTLTYANLGGVILDQRALLAAHYLDYTPAQRTDAALMGVWSSGDGFSGGGMTGNLLTGSDGLTTGWYTRQGGTGSVPVTVPGQPDPLGGKNAVQVTFATSAGTQGNDYSQYYQTVTPITSGVYTNAVWVKSCSGTAIFEATNGLLEGQVFTATTTWQRFFSTANDSGTLAQIDIGLHDAVTPITGVTSCLVIYGEQFTPGIAVNPYVSTTWANAAVPIATGVYLNGQPVAFGSGNVTNNAQTQAAIVPNTAPAAGQDLVGNAGGTAYAPVTMSGDCTRSSSGAITCTKSNGTALGPLATESIVTTGQGGLGVNNSSASGVPVFASGTSTVTAQVGISGGSPVKATNTYGCLDGYDHLPCVVWKAATLTGQTGNAFPPNFVPSKAGLYRVTTMACITTVGTSGTVQPSNLMGTSLSYNYQPAAYALHFTSALGSCSVQRTDERAEVSGSSYQIEPYTIVAGNIGGKYSLDAYAEYMGP